MTTPSTPSSKNRIGLGFNRPRPQHLKNPLSSSSSYSGRENGSSGVPPPPTSPLLSPSTMLARKASLNQLTQNSLASIPDGSVGYGLGLGSPTRSIRNGDDGRGRGRATPIGGDVEVGDQVNTPGGMHGTVKFIGVVKGKAGVFVGVELDPDMAGRGKNDGAVDGVRYFTTTHPNSGIFVPLARAAKRNSASSSNPPPTPTLLNLPSPPHTSALTPPAIPTPRRSESPFGFAGRNGIGLAPNTRPSLPRSESPVRRNTPGPSTNRPGLAPPHTPRNVSSAMGGRFGAPSPMPGKMSYGRPRASSIASTNGGGYGAGNTPERPGTSGGVPRISHTPKHSGSSLSLKQPKSHGMSSLRSGSSMGMRSISSLGRHPEDPQETSPIDSAIGLNRSDRDDYDTSSLERTLAEKDQQLQEQAAQLLEMEASFSELQSLVQNAQLPALTSPTSRNGGGFEEDDASQLRAMLREKNERIRILTLEFDSHRADFRSTIDTLELASTETERVYEKRVEDLMAEIQELQDRNEDVESVARQLKQLEELVAELEEGLEDARRGEAEARGEVEFLRGEVERGREELRREREKSAAAVANAAVGKMMRTGSIDNEVEKKDDEIRGLKAIIHSLSRDAVTDTSSHEGLSHLGGTHKWVNGEGEELAKERNTREKLEREVSELQGLIDRKATREDELEKEIELLRKRKETRAGGASGSISEKNPAVGSWGRTSSERSRPSLTVGENEPAATIGGPDPRGIVGSWRRNRPSSASSQNGLTNGDDITAMGSGGLTPITAESSDSGSTLWCEICETAGHDILTCTNMFGSAAGGPASAGPEGEKKKVEEEEEDDDDDGDDDDDDDNDTIASVGEAMETTIATVSGGVSISSSSSQGEDERKNLNAANTNSRVVLEKRRSVHLPAAPPMVSVESSFGPVAGKESGIVDMEKWCAVCERDGHISVDCPLDMDY